MSDAVSFIVSAVGVLVIVTNIVVEVLKKATWDKLPTNILVVIVGIALSVAGLFAWANIDGFAVLWYYVVAAVILGFFVAYAAMFGFDKFKETLENWKAE